MKLNEYLVKNHWNCAVFSKISGVKAPILHKIIKQTGTVNLASALLIEAATKGEVTVWDLIPQAGAIAEQFSYSIEEIKKERNKARDKKRANEK